MASDVDICNMALSHFGSDATVTSINPPDGSVEAGRCKVFLPISRREILEHFDWSFARRRKALTEVANNSDIWQYAYTRPSECLKERRILPAYTQPGGSAFLGQQLPVANRSAMNAGTEQGGAEFIVENGVIYTNEPEAVLIYTVDVTDTTKYPASFLPALSHLLASYIVGGIIRGKAGTQMARAMRDTAMQLGGASAVTDANAGYENTEFRPMALQVR